MKKSILILGAVLAAVLRPLVGRPVAINDAIAAENPALALGLPTGVSSTAVAARRAALINAGTPAIYAMQLAIDAEMQQVFHDHPKARTEEQRASGTPAEVLAGSIIHAQKVEPSKPAKELSESTLEKRDDAVTGAANASANLSGASGAGSSENNGSSTSTAAV